MRLGTAALAVALGCGCNAQISNSAGTSLGGLEPDAGAGPGPTDDGGVTACVRRSVYLNFDGQALTKGPSDATRNTASWMTINQGTAPAYRRGNANRLSLIQSITNGVQRQLSQFSITVTTTRPPAGTSYIMIVLGGVKGDVGSSFGGGVTALDCGDARPDDVAWISDGVSAPQGVINTAVGAIGFGLGLTATSDPKDCMCSWDNNCTPDDTGPCQLGSPITRDTTTARQLCPGASPQQDEVATFRAAFCQ